MKANIPKILLVLILTGGASISYFLRLTSRPVEIIAIHQRSSHFSDVLVKNLPFTDKGKIDWWLKNKTMLEEKYSVPNPGSDGTFYVTFWLFGDGYKEEGKYDRLCFNDMPPPINCIEKDAIFSVDNSTNLGTVFTVYDGDDYRIKEGKIVKIKSRLNHQ